MKCTLDIQLNGCEGSVIRVLGLVERRGYRLVKCSIAEADDQGQQMRVKVSSSRPADLLKRQLERLHDVLHVELKSTGSGKGNRPDLRPIHGNLSGLT